MQRMDVNYICIVGAVARPSAGRLIPDENVRHENAKTGGAFTVALTGYSRNPISKAADRTVQIASEQTMYHSESVSTRIGQLAVIDALVALAAFQDYDASYRAIESTRAATSDAKF